MFEELRQLFREIPHLWTVLAAAVLTLVLVVWGVYGGFQFQASKFFAASPSTGTLSVSCGTTQNILTWTYDAAADSNGVQRGNTGAKNLSECDDYWCWLPSSTYKHQVPTTTQSATYTDTQLQSGGCYEYRIKYSPTLFSKSVFCPTGCDSVVTPSPTPTPSPTSTPSPTPSPTATPPAQCQPRPACLDLVSPCEIPEPIGGWCPTPTPSPTPSPTLTPTPSPTPSATVTPTGTPFPPGALRCIPEYQLTGVNREAELDAVGGTGIYSWNPGPGAVQQDGGASFVVYRWLTAGLKNVLVSSGGQQAICQVQVASDSTPLPTQTPTATPTIVPSTTVIIVSGPGGVETGPEGSVILAFVLASSVSLLYAAHTKSAAFRAHEVEQLSKQHDQPDFRA